MRVRSALSAPFTFAALALAACSTNPPNEGPGLLKAEAKNSEAAATAAASAASAARPAVKVATAASAPAAAASAAATRPAVVSGLPPTVVPAGAPSAPPSGPPPFAQVIRDAKQITGPLVMWQKDDKLWIEIAPEQFGKPFLLSPKIKSGIGEAWVLGGLMAGPVNGAGGPQLVEFVRVHNTVRLQARNTEVTAKAGSAEARAVADSYSHSLLGATAVASQPHPERKSVLVEANGLFLTDMLGLGMMLQRAFRQGYAMDRGSSVITAARGSAEASVIETQNHFYSGNITTFSFNAPPGAPVPQVPRYLADARSLLVSLNFSLAPLPETPMPTRRADPRLGLFTTTVMDFSDESTISPRQRYITRWRLEKKDPAAPLSAPVKPITFWIDRNVPPVYRPTVKEAILEWNKAFEKIGIKDAIVVEQQPDDAPWDTLDFGRASVRWMMNADPAFSAIGPSHVDPRSGEILDADIAFEGLSTRAMRGVRSQVLSGLGQAFATTLGRGVLAMAPVDGSAPGMGQPGGGVAALAQGAQGVQGPQGAQPFNPAATLVTPSPFAAPFTLLDEAGDGHGAWCRHGEMLAQQVNYALDVLDARGELDAEGKATQQFVLDYVKEALMHEVGHALGLRHNFRASRAYTESQLSDPEFTRVNGTSGSIMEYTPVNLPRPGRPGGTNFMTTLGPYDYWAIEYAYQPAAKDATPAQERERLLAIAARSSQPELAYGTDEDGYFGIDPETIQFDLGADPIAFATKRIDIARDLFERQEKRQLAPDKDYAVLRRSLGYALNDVARSVGVLLRQIGGVRTLRDFPGSGRDPLLPVPAATQRAAMESLLGAILAPEGLKLSAPLQRRLAPDYMERAEFAVSTDFPVPQYLLDLQRGVLGYLMSDWVAVRVLDSVSKFDRSEDAFQLRELYQRLAEEVWGELGMRSGPGPAHRGDLRNLTPARRELQREHANRLAFAVLRPSVRTVARGVLRTQARDLLPRLEAAARRSDLNADTRAHFADSADTLRRALAAPLPRLGL